MSVRWTGPRPPSVLGRDVIAALVTAGVLREGERITRVVIDAHHDALAVIHVQLFADERLLEVLSTLEGVEIREAGA